MAETHLPEDDVRSRLFEPEIVEALFSALKRDERYVRKSYFNAIVELAWGEQTFNLTAMKRTYLEKNQVCHQLFHPQVIETLLLALKDDQWSARRCLFVIESLAEHGKRKFQSDTLAWTYLGER